MTADLGDLDHFAREESISGARCLSHGVREYPLRDSPLNHAVEEPPAATGEREHTGPPGGTGKRGTTEACEVAYSSKELRQDELQINQQGTCCTVLQHELEVGRN